MQILSIETSDRTGSVALIVDGAVVEERQLASHQRTAQSLAPAVASLIKHSAASPDAVAVSVGPGSFTGLRVGVATAKTLAWAWSIPVLAVGTLAAIGAQAVPHLLSLSETKFPLWLSVASNAYRSQVFQCEGLVEAGGTIRWSASSAIDHSKWLQGLAETADYATGPALLLRRTAEQEANLRKIATIPEWEWCPRAGTVGLIGAVQFKSGQVQTPESLLPDYGRVSAAEENLS